MGDHQIMSLTEFTAWMAERGVTRSREEWYRRIRAGHFGQRIGTQWVVSLAEAQAVLESFQKQDP